jgi:DAK2 domain fusion protein YloV
VVASDSPAARGTSGPDDCAQAPSQAVSVLNGVALHELLNAGLAWLDQHHEIVNALNVFPVPDGDTGTNMLLTMRSACQEIKSEGAQSISDVARAAAHGALMGARGNSGVILSQILRGIARRLEGENVLTGPRFAAALSEGSRIAYKGVNKPVEGTILTVVREAAAAAESASHLNPDLRFVLERTLRAADESVANTPKLLPILAQTGKVDSGGKGLYFILEGMYRSLSGETALSGEAPASAVSAQPAITVAQPAKGQRELPSLVYGFDVQFLLEGPRLDANAIQERIVAMGEYGLVEGDGNLIKVHVHVPDPGAVLSYAIGLGFVTDVVVENMDDMSIPDMPAGYDSVPPRFKEAATAAETIPAAPPDEESVEAVGVVVVAPGQGLAQVFKSLGAQAVVSGGQTMNPSTQELLQAIDRIPNREIIILPNNSNIIMTAQQAQLLAAEAGSPARQVSVVPSKTVPQGISALLALNPNVDMARNVQIMTAALGHVQTGEVTIAVHDARFDGITVHSGAIIGLLNDELTATGPDSGSVVKALLEQMHAADLEIITLYYGQPIAASQAESLRTDLREFYADQEIEVVDGGQPFYHYIISAE